MSCPFFVDYTRECLKEVKSLPANTLDFCLSEKHENCPFYRTIKKIGFTCECVSGCPAYEFFQLSDFEKFTEMVNQYCLSENNVNCKRYIIKKQGKTPPSDLLPDGSYHT